MKKISKVSIFVLLFSLFFGSTVLAATQATTKPVVIPAKSTVIAEVNVFNAKISSQKENTLNISFDISNREGVQPGVKYGIRLIQESEKSKIVADEYIYPEVLSLNTNTTITKNIVYVAPTNLNGPYTVMVYVKNYSGLPLGISNLGKVTLVATLKTVEIIQNTCQTSINGNKNGNKDSISKGIVLTPAQKLILTCEIVNNGKVAVSNIPVYETHLNTSYGEILNPEGGDKTPVVLNPGEHKIVSFLLPKVNTPQSYALKMSLKEKEISSNSIIVYYIVKGLSASIQNFSLDKDSYQKNETAKISLFYYASSGDTTAPVITLKASILNEKGKKCINPISQTLTKVGLVEIPVPVISNCNNPKAIISLNDKDGNILDQKQLAFESKVNTTKTSSSKLNLILIILGILVVAGIILYFIKLKKNQAKLGLNQSNETNNQ